VTGAATAGAAAAAAGALFSRRLEAGQHRLWGLSDAGDPRRSGERELERVDRSTGQNAVYVP
jgi:hypothetical protein